MSTDVRDTGTQRHAYGLIQDTHRQHNRSGQGLGPQEVWDAIKGEGYQLDGPAYQAALVSTSFFARCRVAVDTEMCAAVQAAYDPDRNGKLELTEL